MSPKKREERAITIRLTDDEYAKIVKLAEIRHMNPTEYTRHAALGNRIKPTVIEYTKSENEIQRSLEGNNMFGEKSEGEKKNIKKVENTFFDYSAIDEDMFKNITLNDIMK